jgi:hypothetical protein
MRPNMTWDVAVLLDAVHGNPMGRDYRDYGVALVPRFRDLVLCLMTAWQALYIRYCQMSPCSHLGSLRLPATTLLE